MQYFKEEIDRNQFMKYSYTEESRDILNLNLYDIN